MIIKGYKNVSNVEVSFLFSQCMCFDLGDYSDYPYTVSYKLLGGSGLKSCSQF
jgi:hypothetical protein